MDSICRSFTTRRNPTGFYTRSLRYAPNFVHHNVDGIMLVVNLSSLYTLDFGAVRDGKRAEGNQCPKGVNESLFPNHGGEVLDGVCGRKCCFLNVGFKS